MKVVIRTSALSTLATPALIIPVPEGRDDELPAELNRLIPKPAHQSFAGKMDEVLVVFPSKGSIERIVLVGLGDGKGSRTALELFRRAIGLASREVARLKLDDCSLYLGGIFEPDYVREAVVTARVAPYRYERHKTGKTESTLAFRALTLVAPGATVTSAHRTALKEAGIIGEAILTTRNLVNAPSNHLTPSGLAQAARELAKDVPNLTVSVMGAAALAKQKFGGLLAVSQGSHEEPQLITLDYHPSLSRRSSSGVASRPLKTVVLVGKGVTFDTGGINLKPGHSMGDMFLDMSGGAAVIAAVTAAAQLKLPLHVVGIVPATENMPSGRALKPGDIITSRSGQTIEVVDTDAEGRIILGDALDYAAAFKPDLVVDIATLTGATIIALGEERASLIGNDQPLIDQLLQAGERSGELGWQLPLDDDYRAHVKSTVADVNNIGKAKSKAGTIAGAAFLEKFVPKGTPWAHVDIGGTAMRSEAGPYWPKGGSGWGTKLLIEFLHSLST